ncbi:MAG: RNA methyltransferase [Candidatus Jidaibacter sp.]|jgi:tRNA/rRNA methyltransferase|nr:RNA methyltransferase [Candidatus Jidaibacter sp.]
MSTVIILSHPQMGENIGATARAMSNFGLDELRIVAPRDGWPNQRAYALAANGEFVLDKAQIFQDLPSAIADIQTLYGTASGDRDMAKSTLAPWQITKNLDFAKVGILFGCERSGLTNDELSVCDHIIKIPTSHLNPSLNLAQAVMIIAYELGKTNAAATTAHPRASKGEVMHMLSFLQTALEERNFFKSQEMKPTMMRNITNLFVKAALTEQEVRTLYGIFKAFL